MRSTDTKLKAIGMHVTPREYAAITRWAKAQGRSRGKALLNLWREHMRVERSRKAIETN